MACGCSESCPCCVTDTDTISWTGSGALNDCYMATVMLDPDGCLVSTPGVGISIQLDPASPAAITCGPDGLSVECCSACVVDSDSIDFSLPGGCVSGDVIIDPDGGLVTTPGQGVGILIDPASTAPVSTGVAGLRVDCCGESVEAQPYIPLLKAGGFLIAGQPAGNYIMASGEAQLNAANQVFGMTMFYVSASYAVPAMSTEWRLLLWASANNAVAGVNLTASIVPITAYAGVAGNLQYTFGAAVATAVVVATANTISANFSANVAEAANGHYAILLTNNVAIPVNSLIKVEAQWEIRHV